MLKILSQLEHKIGDNLYHFICSPNSPITEVKEACYQFLKYVGKIEDAQKAQGTPEVPATEAENNSQPASLEAPKEG